MQYFLLQPILKDADAVRQYRKALETFAKESFNKLNESVNWDKEWPMGPAVVDAAYMPSQNSISKYFQRLVLNCVLKTVSLLLV